MNDLKYALALKEIKSVGPATIKKLRISYGSPKEIFELPKKELLNSIPSSIAKLIPAIDKLDVEKYRDEINIATNNKIKIISIWDSEYPMALLNIPNPPPILYLCGKSCLNDKKMISIIGTRNPTNYGKTFANELSTFLAENGYTIVSGMAKGIDRQAHIGALNVDCGKTIAVLGCGLQDSYTHIKKNEQCIDNIKKNGAVISEVSIDSITTSWNLKNRNRIITGLSMATVLIEADLKSGSFSSTNYAKKQKKPLICLQPKNEEIQQAQLPKRLIAEGALSIHSVDDAIISILDNITYSSKSHQMIF